ncbi:hypothetical protein [Prevotellamassilia timonensis]|uniref:hypothetical protein n=1 Tax=Prevotellamassilia timonensis TaxID=1852370 RepID=UPI003FEE591B
MSSALFAMASFHASNLLIILRFGIVITTFFQPLHGLLATFFQLFGCLLTTFFQLFGCQLATFFQQHDAAAARNSML